MSRLLPFLLVMQTRSLWMLSKAEGLYLKSLESLATNINQSTDKDLQKHKHDLKTKNIKQV